MIRNRAPIRVDRSALAEHDTTWMDNAPCAGRTALFFAYGAVGRGRPPGTLSPEQAEAIEICSTCPVLIDCRAYALDTRQEFGIWGGQTETQRRSELRRRRELALASTQEATA